VSAERRNAESPERTWTVVELLRWMEGHFRERGLDSPRLDAECLLARALGVERIELYLQHDKPVVEAERARLRELVRRRAGDRIPVAQLTGRKEFWSLPLEVTGDVLVPRPETETLVEVALGLLPDREGEYHVLDVGTGSGAVALALAHERRKARVLATDRSAEALAVAERNAERLGLADRVRFEAGPGLEPALGQRFDLVVSNPPYLADGEAADLAPELAHEPPGALFAGPEGTELLESLVAGAPHVLATSAGIAVELAPQQADRVVAWCEAAGLADVTVTPDLAGRPRVVSARASAEAPAGASWTRGEAGTEEGR
jgi:release factor glutamine methyltransferase